MAFEAGLLRSDSLTVEPGGFRLSLGLPWMRSLPFSSLLDVRLLVNGAAVSPSNASFRVRGCEVGLDELADWWDRFWFLQERISVAVRGVRAPLVGEPVDITVEMDLRIPYILTGPGRPLILTQSLGGRLAAVPAGPAGTGSETKPVPREVA